MMNPPHSVYDQESRWAWLGDRDFQYFFGESIEQKYDVHPYESIFTTKNDLCGYYESLEKSLK
eukprot:UN25956